MKKEQGAVVDRRGNAIGAVAVTVYDHGTTDLSTIYSDNGITPQANPFNVDSYGRWSFYVANGRYDIKFSGSTINVFLMEDILIEDAASANAVSIQGHDVNEAALGDDKILVYKVAGDEFVYEAKEAPAAHADTHENGGGDEISVTGLSGLLADPQDPTAHHLDHENGGGDEIDVTDLGGLLADPQIPLAHKTSHENGGGDEISVTDLSGLLADAQTPLAHKTSHENAGGDEISVAGLSGVLGDKQDADKIQGHTVDETAIGNDKVLVYKTSGTKFVYESKGTPGIHALSHQDGGGDEISVAGLSGVLGDKQDADKIQGHTVDETDIGNDKVLVYKTVGKKFVYEAKGTPAGHAASHQDGGGDEIDLTDLSGSPADCVISAGRAGGQIVYGGTGAGDDLTLYSTSHATKGSILLPDTGVEAFVFGTPIGSSHPTLFDLNVAMTTSAVSSIQSIAGIRGTIGGANPLGDVALDIRVTITPTVDAMCAYGLASTVHVDVPTGKTLDWINALYAGIGTLSGGGTVNYGVGLYIDELVLGSIKPTNVMGIYVENQGATGVTNAYGLWIPAISGASTLNLSAWLGGDVAIGGQLVIGSNSPLTEKLNIVGDILLSGNAVRSIKGDTKDGGNNSEFDLVGAGTGFHFVKAIATGGGSIGGFLAYNGGGGGVYAGFYHDGTNGNVVTSSGDLALLPNSGYVKFGTYAGKAAEVHTGFITIKDAGGTSRKVMVCA